MADMQPSEAPLLAACLAQLRAVPGMAVEWQDVSASREFDGTLIVRLGPRRTVRFPVEVKRTHLSYALVDGLIARRAQRWVLCAPYVARPMGEYLESHQVNYVDGVGNCHLATPTELLVHIEGRKPTRAPEARGAGRLASHQLAFAVLVDAELLNQPVRRLAEAAGIGKSAVADQLKRWIDQGIVGRTPSGLRLVRRKVLLDRWLGAYPDVVRPSWLVGTFRMKDSKPEEVEHALAQALGEQSWALGGAAAAWHLNHHLAPDEVVVHLRDYPQDLPRRLRAIPADKGVLIVLRTPGTLAYEGPGPHLAQPLLVYTEMLCSRDARVRSAAEHLREQFLPDS